MLTGVLLFSRLLTGGLLFSQWLTGGLLFSQWLTGGLLFSQWLTGGSRNRVVKSPTMVRSHFGSSHFGSSLMPFRFKPPLAARGPPAGRAAARRTSMLQEGMGSLGLAGGDR